MPRRLSGARLYLDPKRRQWVIRDGARYLRTGLNEDALDAAQERLMEYQVHAPRVQSRDVVPLGKIVGFIYFVSAAYPRYPVKIGFTEKIGGARIKSLQIACPYPIVVVGHMRGTMNDEFIIHDKFDHLRMMGEWFRRGDDLMEFIKENCGDTFNPMT